MQNELSYEENLQLTRKFLQENFVAAGMIVDFAIHDPERNGTSNPHFHVMAPIRPLNPDGTWGAKQRMVYRLDEAGQRIRKPNGKYAVDAVPTTDWGRPETLDRWREAWADLVNQKLDKKGLDCRIDHRSYAEQAMLLKVVEAIPGWQILKPVVLVLITLSFVTLANSMTSTVALMTIRNNSDAREAPASIKLFWGCHMGATALVFTLTGNIEGIKIVKTLAGFPILLLGIAMVLLFLAYIRRGKDC